MNESESPTKDANGQSLEQPPEDAQGEVIEDNATPAPRRTLSSELGRISPRTVAGVTAAAIAVATVGGIKGGEPASAPHREVPKAQIDRNNGKVEHIRFVANDAIGRTQEILWLLREKYITPEYWDGVVVIKGGTKLSLTPNNQTLELADSAENEEAKAGFKEVPKEETWVAKDPKIFGTIHGSDYLYFEVDGEVYWLDINSPDADRAEWYLTDRQSGQVNQVQFDGEGKQISPLPNPKEGASFKRIDRGDWHRYLELIGVDKGKPPTDILPSGY